MTYVSLLMNVYRDFKNSKASLSYNPQAAVNENTGESYGSSM